MANNDRITIETFPPTRTQTFKVCFHEFESLPSEKGHVVNAPEFSCFGFKWRLRFFPGGEMISRDGMVGLYLKLCSESEFESDSKVKIRYKLEINQVARDGTEDFTRKNWGFKDFMSRSTMLEELQNGSLIVTVSLTQTEHTHISPQEFVPPNPFPFALQKTFNDEKSGDILFTVGGNTVKKEGKKRAKTTPVTFHAHLLILKECAPILADFCEGFEDKRSVSIIETEPNIFGYMLEYIYGRNINENDVNANAKEIIEAADKYGVVGLKLKAEACYVESTKIDMGNVVDNLRYAESKNCALLNEAVMDYISDNITEFLEKISIERSVPGSMLADLLASVARGREKSPEKLCDRTDFNTMRVSALRKMCYEKGLDFDGSRKTMVELLKNAQENSS